ncbi:MAG: hypothetical protein ACI8PZ_002747 [Myxococcota bacterium]|jgi:hypothetical protein
MIAALAMVAFGADIDVYRGDDLWAAVASALPGDTVRVHAGLYTTQQLGGSWLRQVELRGTVDAPIVVESVGVVVLEGDPAGSENVVELDGEHFIWRGFEHRYGSHGVRLNAVSDATLEALHVHDTADVGISANRPGNDYARVRLLRNHVHHTLGTGECFYLGCNDGDCTFHEGEVVGNWCHDTWGSSQGDGIEVKTGSWGNLIADNVVHDTRYPGITMYGTGGMPPNRVVGNAVWATGDNGIQVVGDVELVNNLVLGAGIYGIHIKESQGLRPAALLVAHNTVVGAAEACLKLNETDEADGRIVSNALYCPETHAIRVAADTGTLRIARNVVLGIDEAGGQLPGRSLADDMVSAITRDLYPTPDSPLVDAPLDDPADALSGEDVWGGLRDALPDVGAWEYVGDKDHRWIPGPDFKPVPFDPPPDTGDTGVPVDTETPGTTPTSEPTDTGGTTDTPTTPVTPGTTPTSDTAAGDDPKSGCGCTAVPSEAAWLGPWARVLARRSD